MKIRPLTLSDDLDKVAELIYETDPYIYPYWFKNYTNWKQILIKLIKTKGSIFYYKNIIVAVECYTIIGIVIVLDDKDVLNYNYLDLLKVDKYFEYTINNYIMHICSNINNNAYIPNVCVNENHRNKGVGYQLINYVKDNYKKDISLHCLSNNKAAIGLYLKCGFQSLITEKGFNAPHCKKPTIVRMLYIRNTT